MVRADESDCLMETILDLARWAPSGDNTQPWRFEITGPRQVTVHGFDTRDHCVYDLDGHSSQLAIGAMLETLAIGASAHGLKVECKRRLELPDSRPTFDVRLQEDPACTPDPLHEYIQVRSVQRRPFSMRRLLAGEKRALERAIEPDFHVVWLEDFQSRAGAAILMFQNAKLRLTMPEAYRVHREIIAWNTRYSEDKVPDQALGLDALTLRLMRWIMESWARVQFFNTYLAGTWAPRLQMDLIPGIRCAAHFVIQARRPPDGVDDYVAAGRAVQRFWLTATQLRLQLQPELTPLIFRRFVRHQLGFTQSRELLLLAQRLSQKTDGLIGAKEAELAVFIGRIGDGKPPFARSLRLPLTRLILD